MSLNVSWIAQYAAPKWPARLDVATSGTSSITLRSCLLDAAIRTRDRPHRVECVSLLPLLRRERQQYSCESARSGEQLSLSGNSTCCLSRHPYGDNSRMINIISITCAA